MVVSVGFVGLLIGASFVSVTGEGDIAVDVGEIANFMCCGGGFSLTSIDGSALVTISINNGPELIVFDAAFSQ